MNKVLEAKKITKSYSDGEATLHVLKDVNFAVYEGERVSLVGRSGAGKSTLLHILAGLTDPSTGVVEVMRQNMSAANPAMRAELRRAHMGFVYQHHHLLADFTAYENLLIPQLIAKVQPAKAEHKARQLLDAVGLAERHKHYPSQLSGGERQRVALTRALATNPQIVLADEPTGNLDKDNESRVLELMRQLSEEHNAAFLVVTHDERIAAQADRVLSLDDGHLS